MSKHVEHLLEALTEATDKVSYLVLPGGEGSDTSNATQVQGLMIAGLMQDLAAVLAHKGIIPKSDFASVLAQAGALAETIETPTTSQAPSAGTVELVQEAYENIVEAGQRKKTLHPAIAPAEVSHSFMVLRAVTYCYCKALSTRGVPPRDSFLGIHVPPLCLPFCHSARGLQGPRQGEKGGCHPETSQP